MFRALVVLSVLIAAVSCCTVPASFNCGRAYVNGSPQGDKQCVRVDGKAVTTAIYCKYQDMKSAAASAGITLRLNSGFRTMAEQERLYGLYRAGRGNLAARPGFSNHQNGIALDIDVSSDRVYQWLRGNAQRFGFIRAVASETWHWEYRPGSACNAIVRYTCTNGGSSPSGGNSCNSNGRSGVCMDAARCSGTRVRGLCPGASNIQCCIGGSDDEASATFDDEASATNEDEASSKPYTEYGGDEAPESQDEASATNDDEASATGDDEASSKPYSYYGGDEAPESQDEASVTNDEEEAPETEGGEADDSSDPPTEEELRAMEENAAYGGDEASAEGEESETPASEDEASAAAPRSDKRAPAAAAGGDKNAKIVAQAKKMYNMSTREGPERGNKACAWAVNKVLKAAINLTIGSNPNAVPSVHDWLKKNATPISQGQQKPGDIVIAPNIHHVGIWMDNGKVLSNSSSKAAFRWYSGINFDGYFGKSGRSSIYRLK